MSPSPAPGLLDESDVAQYVETSSGGDYDWLTFTSKKLYTNAFIVLPGPPRKVPLVMKLLQHHRLLTMYELVDSSWIQETWIWCEFVSESDPSIMCQRFIQIYLVIMASVVK